MRKNKIKPMGNCSCYAEEDVGDVDFRARKKVDTNITEARRLKEIDEKCKRTKQLLADRRKARSQ